MKILREEKLCNRVEPLGNKIIERLTKKLGQHPHVAEIRGKGLLIGIEIVQNKSSLEPFPEEHKITGQVMQKGLEQGVFLYPGGTGEYRDIICIGPAFIIEDSEIDQIVEVAESSIKAVTEQY